MVSAGDVGAFIAVVAALALAGIFAWDWYIKYYEPVKGGIGIGYITLLRWMGTKSFDTFTGWFWDITGKFEADRRTQLTWREHCLDLRRRQVRALINLDGSVKEKGNENVVAILREWVAALAQNRNITFGEQMRILVSRDYTRTIHVFVQLGYLKPLTEYAASSPYGEADMLWMIPGRFTRLLVEAWVQDIPRQETDYFRMVPELKRLRDAHWHYLIPKVWGKKEGPPISPPSEMLVRAVATWPAARVLQRTEDIMKRHVSAAKDSIRRSEVANYMLKKKESDISLGLQYWESEGPLKIQGAVETPTTVLGLLFGITAAGGVIGTVYSPGMGSIIGMIFGGVAGLLLATEWQKRRG